MSGATHAKHALTQRLEFMELQLNESKALVYVAGTDNKDKSDITNMRLDSLENCTYYAPYVAPHSRWIHNHLMIVVCGLCRY